MARLLFHVTDNPPPNQDMREVWITAPSWDKAFSKAVSVFGVNGPPISESLTIRKVVNLDEWYEVK